MSTIAPEKTAAPRAAGGGKAATFLTALRTGLALVLRPSRGGKPRFSASITPGRIVVGIVVVALVALWQMILIDAWTIKAVLHLPRPLITVFDWITDFGRSGWFLWPLGIALLVLAAAVTRPLTPLSQRVLAALAVRLEFLFAAIAVPGLFVTIVKRLIGRARPFVGGEANPFLFHPFVWRADYASMPSGHVTTAFAIAIAFTAVWPRTRIVVWTYAWLIAASRIIVSAHHPSDVVVAAVAGVFGAFIVRDFFAVRGRVFAIGDDGRVGTMPGPSAARLKRVARAVLGQ
jgi:membrane-associated phospholipid phosphatase